MQRNRKTGPNDTFKAEENGDQRLCEELLEFASVRLPKFKWLREVYAPDDGRV